MQAQTAVVSAPSLAGRRALAVLLGAALVAIAAQIAIPLPGTPVPMTLQPLAVLLVGALLGPGLGAGSMILYLALGAAGLPVFTPYGLPGLARLVGPTGGYLLAYPVAAFAVGKIAGDGRRVARLALAAAAGLVLIHLGGLAQLAILTGSGSGAVRLGTLPFLAGDLVKLVIAVLLLAVVGAGTMGNGIAHVFAQHGWDTTLIDVAPGLLERVLAVIRTNLERQVKKGSVTAEQRDAALARIRTSMSLDSVADAQLVVEAATEQPDVKFKIFRDIDRLAPPAAILASNTSSISITAIAAQTKRPAQVIGMHFMNPVPVMPLVEVVRGLETADKTVAEVVEVAKALGKTPVEVNDAPGFVSNRVLMPMINEAIFCVMEGVATPEAIDTVMKLGMNHPVGPLALADLIGLDVCLAILEVLHRDLGDDKYRAAPLLRTLVAAGRLGRKSGRGFYVYRD